MGGTAILVRGVQYMYGVIGYEVTRQCVYEYEYECFGGALFVEAAQEPTTPSIGSSFSERTSLFYCTKLQIFGRGRKGFRIVCFNLLHQQKGCVENNAFIDRGHSPISTRLASLSAGHEVRGYVGQLEISSVALRYFFGHCLHHHAGIYIRCHR